jgi:hypothetical protein
LTTSIYAAKDPTPIAVVSAQELKEKTEGVLLSMKEHHREVVILRHLLRHVDSGDRRGHGHRQSGNRAQVDFAGDADAGRGA